MEEGLLPGNAQVLLSWSHGPGLIAETANKDERTGAVLGYLQEVGNGAGMVPLVSLLRCTKSVAFMSEQNQMYHIDIDLFEESGLSQFSKTASLFWGPRDGTRPSDERSISLWQSAFERDATFESDIILILARLLGFRRSNIQGARGLRKFMLSTQQRKTFGKAAEAAKHSTRSRKGRSFGVWLKDSSHDVRSALYLQIGRAHV